MKKSLGEERTIGSGGGHSYAFKAGDQLGSFEIVHPLGAGGMGEVYLVEHTLMRKRYALKVLPRLLFTNNRFVDRFKLEARVMADLYHPNIVQVHHMDVQDGIYYLTMDFVAGTNDHPDSLDDLLKRNNGKLDEARIQKIMHQICDALVYAHGFRGEGVIHRDLKPGNILLDAEKDVKIADFGLAKVVGTDYLRDVIERSISLSLHDVPDVSIGDQKTVTTLLCYLIN